MSGVKAGRAIVTGGASGIGLAISQALSARGDRVAILDKDVKLMRNKHDKATGGDDPILIEVDVTVSCEVSRAVRCASRELGGLDVLVNSAGILGGAGLLSLADADLEHVIAVNLLGTIYTSKYAVQEMKTGDGGVIVNIASVAALNGSVFSPTYAAAKAGVIGFTKSLARKYGRHNIRANCVCPGSVSGTNFLQASRGSGITPAEQLALDRSVPIGRCIRPHEVACLVAFVTSLEASGLNGATIILDGGEALGS